MTKTVKEITAGDCLVMAFMHGIQSDFLPKDEVRQRIAGFRASNTYTEILKELEAIIRAAKPPIIDTQSRRKLYAKDEDQMWYDRGQNDTIKRYEANLLTALYEQE